MEVVTDCNRREEARVETMAEFKHSDEAVIKPGETIPLKSDFIPRTAAVLALLAKGQRSRRYHIGEIWELNFEEIREALGAIPAANVREVVRGEWVGYPESFKYEHVYDRDAIVCPFCEEPWNIVDNDTERFNCCPNCGADMKGEAE